MKKIFMLGCAVILTGIIFAQVPQRMSYQAVVRNASNQLITDSNVGVRISISQSPDTGAVVFSETHQVQTNQNGLFSLVIGVHSPINIDWTMGPYYIKTDIDPSGGDNYTIHGSSELLSVPYAMYAQSSGNSGQGGDLWSANDVNQIYFDGWVGVNTRNFDARLKVEDHHPSDSTRTLHVHANGGYAISAFTAASTRDDWRNVGVYSQVYADSLTGGRGVWGHATGNSLFANGVWGEAESTVGTNTGVRGFGLSRNGNNSQTFGGAFFARGYWDAAQGVGTGTHYGIFSSAEGAGPWNLGVSTQARNGSNINRGIQAVASGTNGPTNQGGVFFAIGAGHPELNTRNVGFIGQATENRMSNTGVSGLASGAAVSPSADAYGVTGYAYGVGGAIASGLDAYTDARQLRNVGVSGIAEGRVTGDSINIGVYGFAQNADTSYGVFASAIGGEGVLVNYALYAEAGNAPENYAGYFDGNVTVTGLLRADQLELTGASLVRTENPLDPANTYLVHSAVESAEMIRIYSGNVATDADGYARVMLPDYVAVAGTDFRYQLTTIGSFAQAIIGEEMRENSFVVRTSEPGVKVSWQVTAVRTDAFAQDHQFETVRPKRESEKGIQSGMSRIKSSVVSASRDITLQQAELFE